LEDSSILRGANPPRTLAERPKILFIDPDMDLCSIASDYFVGERYTFEAAHEGTGALAAVFRCQPDLVIADTDTPGLDGIELLYRLGPERSIPLILLGNHCSLRDRIGLLEAGADDYLTKPFVFGELVARARAVLRRVGRSDTQSAREEITAGNLRLHPGTRQVWVNECPHKLTRLEFEVLAVLARSAGSVFSTDRMMTVLCRPGFVCRERSIYTTISTLRTKLGRYLRPRIQTIRGIGYTLPAVD
jgi:DNA-binding response OmpR family regulator